MEHSGSFPYCLYNAKYYFTPRPTKCQVRNEAPNLGLMVLVRAMTNLMGGDRQVWSNGGMMIRRKTKELKRKTFPVPLCPHT
jgi:hypothetical protein